MANAIEDLRSEQFSTHRFVSEELESCLYKPFPVLDHGFVRVVDYMGGDPSIVQAARVSYGKGTKKVSQDRGLIHYLMRHRHSTPFEMCEIKFHIKLPIFIARQWIRHRTANVNEYSARYSILSKEFYVPQAEHIAGQSKVNNQGRGDVVSPEEAKQIQEMIRADSEQLYARYEELLNLGDDGEPRDSSRPCLAREIARSSLSLNYYTEWYWKVDLHNLMHFLSLRADSHAQYEIRAYANVMLELLKKWTPITYEAFMKYRMNGAHLSSGGLDIVRRMIAGEKVSQEDTDLSPREWRELMSVLGQAKTVGIDAA